SGQIYGFESVDNARLQAQLLITAPAGEIDKATRRLGVGNLVDSIIDAKDGSILLLEAKELILVVITQRTVNLGLVKMEMRRAAKRISEAVPI
ncbi:MAG: roadblock/LC7 domain-containing protein, partial [Chloroflexus sp.]